MSDIWRTTSLVEGGVTEGGAGSAAATLRASVLEKTDAAERAVLAPQDSGAWPADMRAALAARIARLNGQEQVAKRYEARQQGQGYASLADPASNGGERGLAEVLAFMDKVARSPKDVASDDIAALKAAGTTDADIVRLCELNAFLAYQLRLVAGLKLMTGPPV